MEEAAICGYSIERSFLELSARKGRKALKNGIQEHEEWLQNKIKKQTFFALIFNPIACLNRERKIALITLVKEMLLNSHKKDGRSEHSNLYTITDETCASPQWPLSPGFLYNPLDTKVDIEWMYFPHIFPIDIVETVMKDLISHDEIFSFDTPVGEYFWLRY